MTVIPALAAVQCPVCRRTIPLSGLYGEVVPWHRRNPQQQTPCPGEGAVVLVSGAGLVAVLPDPEEVGG